MDQFYPFEVIPLPHFSMMPCCDPNTLYLHYGQHYQSEVDRLNRLVVRHRLTHLSLEELLTVDINLPVAQVSQIRDAAGSVYNHQLYFDSIAANALPPHGPLATQLIATYGSMERFFRLLSEAAESIAGSGWVWLVAEENGALHLVVTRDNLTPALSAVRPIFVIDLWEHAFFPMNHFDKSTYLFTWFSTLDWAKANQRFLLSRTLQQFPGRVLPDHPAALPPVSHRQR